MTPIVFALESYLMRLLLLVGMLLGLAGMPARAQQEPSLQALEAARELMAVMSPEISQQIIGAVMTPVFDNMSRRMAGRIDPETIAELRAEFEKVGNRFVGVLLAEGPALYARHFTADELRDMTAFYRTPTGAKALQLMPKLSADMFAMILPRMTGLQRELEAAAAEVMRRRGYDPGLLR